MLEDAQSPHLELTCSVKKPSSGVIKASDGNLIELTMWWRKALFMLGLKMNEMAVHSLPGCRPHWKFVAGAEQHNGKPTFIINPHFVFPQTWWFWPSFKVPLVFVNLARAGNRTPCPPLQWFCVRCVSQPQTRESLQVWAMSRQRAISNGWWFWVGWGWGHREGWILWWGSPCLWWLASRLLKKFTNFRIWKSPLMKYWTKDVGRFPVSLNWSLNGLLYSFFLGFNPALFFATQ